MPAAHLHAPVWGTLFGGSSLISPFLLGACFGSLTAGDIHVLNGQVSSSPSLPWLSPYAIACGLLAVAACAYLAAVYLAVETSGKLQADFRLRAIIGGTTTALLAALVLALASANATWFFQRLFSPAALPAVIAGALLFALSAWAVFTRRFRLARMSAAGQIVLLLAGWAIAHQQYLIYPDLPLQNSAGPPPTIRFMVVAISLGLLAVIPSLFLLFKVFKATPAPAESSTQGPNSGS